MISVTYGYARVSKTDREDRNLSTQLKILSSHGIREEHIFAGRMTGRSGVAPCLGQPDVPGATK